MSNSPACKGQRFGHNFAGSGGPCLNGCGISQKELSGQLRERAMKKIDGTKLTQRERIHGMHSPSHDLARQISEWCGEPKQFALYLGKVKYLGQTRAWSLWSELKQARTPIRNRAALFMAMTRKSEVFKKDKN